jgi:hypothetical protein
MAYAAEQRKPQISPLRYASVEMTNLLNNRLYFLRKIPSLCNKFVVSIKRLA